jgi:hypothetical protein
VLQAFRNGSSTNKEDMNAIEKLNTGKSADENGIQAEHFRNAKEELARLLCEIINPIFQDLAFNIEGVIHTGCCKLFEMDLPSIH